MSGSSDQESSNSSSEKERKIWEKPELRRLKLSDDEIEALRQSDDPAALLKELWSKIKERDRG